MLTFPWPPAPLKPNVKTHWATKAKATKEYKEMCFYLTKLNNESRNTTVTMPGGFVDLARPLPLLPLQQSP